jgi:hypothetical protein
MTKDITIKKLQTDLDETRRQLDQVVMTRKSEGTALLQNEAYRSENARLLQMLSKTKEYAGFANFAQDSGLGVRYMDPVEE